MPTWNYSAVHVYGRPRLIDDPASVRELLDQTVQTYEGDEGWRATDLPPEFVTKLAESIVAFAIVITRIEGKFKLNQNRSQADRQGVIAALEKGDENACAIAGAMRETI